MLSGLWSEMKSWLFRFSPSERVLFLSQLTKYLSFYHLFQWQLCLTWSILYTSRALRFVQHFVISDVAYHFQVESLHTKLASYYIDEVLKLLEDGSMKEKLKPARARLLSFLESSHCYRAPVLLSRVHDTELYRECALLYGRVSYSLLQ